MYIYIYISIHPSIYLHTSIVPYGCKSNARYARIDNSDGSNNAEHGSNTSQRYTNQTNITIKQY